MNKTMADYVESISQELNLPREQVGKTLKAFKDTLAGDIKNGDTFMIPGLMKSRFVERKGYEATGALAGKQIEACLKPVITISYDLQRKASTALS